MGSPALRLLRRLRSTGTRDDAAPRRYVLFLLMYGGAEYLGWPEVEPGSLGAIVEMGTADVWKPIGFTVLSVFLLQLALRYGGRMLAPTEVQKVQAQLWRARATSCTRARSTSSTNRTASECETATGDDEGDAPLLDPSPAPARAHAPGP